MVYYSDKYSNDPAILKVQKLSNEKNEQSTNEQKEEQYWKIVQGHPNPYGKKFYDYVEAHKNIKFNSNPEIARKEMKEVNYKMQADPIHEDNKTLLCEKSTFRLLLELGLSLLDSI